jgi:hypothetical protein
LEKCSITGTYKVEEVSSYDICQKWQDGSETLFVKQTHEEIYRFEIQALNGQRLHNFHYITNIWMKMDKYLLVKSMLDTGLDLWFYVWKCKYNGVSGWII